MPMPAATEQDEAGYPIGSPLRAAHGNPKQPEIKGGAEPPPAQERRAGRQKSKERAGRPRSAVDCWSEEKEPVSEPSRKTCER